MELYDRTSAEHGHILIGGTGRAGTTLLVQWFTAMGFDTGFTLDEAMTKSDPISKGGLEHPVGRILKRGKRLPYVAKSPWFGTNLIDFLDSGQLSVQMAIIPMRSLESAAESRRQVAARAAESGLDFDKHPGGLLGGKSRDAAKNQERQLARRFYELVHTLVSYDVPMIFLRFPDFAQGRQDLVCELEPLLIQHGVSTQEASAALSHVVRPDLIHDFTAD